MKQTMYLIKRNCAIFFRDKSTVFFSMLSMFITLGLMVIFLGKMNSDNLVQVLAEFGPRDTATDRVNASYLIQLWTLAGILATNSVTVPLTGSGRDAQASDGVLCDACQSSETVSWLHSVSLFHRYCFMCADIAFR